MKSKTPNRSWGSVSLESHDARTSRAGASVLFRQLCFSTTAGAADRCDCKHLTSLASLRRCRGRPGRFS